MERKRKIKRASILAVFIYVMINGFVWGFMKAYLNSYNIISKDQLVMAEVNNNNSKTEIKILNKKFYFDKNKFVCSQFVGHIMEKSGINLDIPKPVCLHTPEDFRHIKSAQLIYKGDLNKFHISEEYNSVNFMENQSVRTA